MIADFRQLEDASTIDTDLCIIGGGAAAISIARELSGSRLNVCILESGGLALESEFQSLAGGDSSGLPYFELTESRYRMLGGSTYRWGARSAPMTEGDFQKRPWLPFSGWPLSLEDLAPYYKRVEELAGLHVPFEYDDRVWDGFDQTPPPFDESKLRFSAFQFGKILLFGEYYREMLRRAPNVSVYLYANATNLQVNDMATHVEHVDVRSLSGKECRVRAKCFVLASGGIENARLLLLSNSVNPVGLCNDHDLVGRFFMEHPTTSVGTIVAKDWERLHDVFSPGLVRGRLVEVGLALAPELQATERCLNAITSARVVAADDSTQALRELLWHVKHRKLPRQVHWYFRNEFITTRMRKVFRDPFGIVANVGRHLAGKPKRFKIDSMYLEVRTEQEPNPESRVTLSDTTDELGQRRAHLHWTLTETDRRTMLTAAQTFDAELRRLGLGEVRMDPWLSSEDGAWSPDLVGGHHHMGTTRMSESADSGVVDAQCKTHALDNLYLVGSSVFATCSYVNPTQTIFALATRLADHLKAELA